MDLLFETSSDSQFNGTLDELPFDILALVFSYLSVSSYFVASEETRNLKVISAKLRNAVTTANLPTWCPVSDYGRLCEYVQKFVSRDKSTVIKSYRKYKTHFPLSRFTNLADIFMFAVNNNITNNNLNSCVRYLLNSKSMTPSCASSLLNLICVTPDAEILVNWASLYDATVLSQLINIAGTVRLSTYKSAVECFHYIATTFSEDEYGGEMMFNDINSMLFFKWKDNYVAVMKLLFQLELGNLEGRLEECGYTVEQYDAFCKEAKRHIRWLSRLTPRKLASANYYFSYNIYHFTPDEVQNYFGFLVIDTVQQIYEVPIISIYRVDRPTVYEMSINNFVSSLEQ
jgi:hypothetical protein